MIKLAPRNGMSVIDPATRRPMPVDGIELESLDSYWLRRCNDGDVVQVEAELAAQANTPASTTMATPRANRKKNGRGQVNDDLV